MLPSGHHIGLPNRSVEDLELRCPPLPQTLLEVMDLINQPDELQAGPVSDVVRRDPNVVARLLHIVNSAYYGLRHTIASADRAVVMLGPVAVAGIILGMHMLKLRSTIDGRAGACFQRLIRHSIATAFLTRHLLEGPPRESVRKPSPVGVGTPFTAGLMHDFGKIILVYNYQDEAARLYDARATGILEAGVNGRTIEHLVFGCDHTEAGEFAARKLKFSDVLISVIRHHHDPRHTTGDLETDRIIRAAAAANLASKAMGYAFSQPVGADEFGLNQVWELLVESDLPRFGSTDEVIDDLLLQQKNLDVYVQHLTTKSTDSMNYGALRRKDDTWEMRQ